MGNLPNTLPMMAGTGPFGPIEMGGMFTVVKVRDGIERYGDPGKLAAMRAIKHALDPKGILNPGAVLRG